MTCRIDRLLIAEDRVLLSISGQITAEYVDLLRTLLEQERSTVAIDLKNVLHVDREAVRLLGALRVGWGRTQKLRGLPP